jgi:hypothetical protein
LENPSDRVPRSCIVPHFTAPGFKVEPISADPVPIGPGRVWWEWVVTPQHDGRQTMFINILYSPQCKHNEAAKGTHDAGFATVFSQTDSAWVSRQWLSVDDFGSTASVITIFSGILALIVAAFEFQKHMTKEIAVPTTEPKKGG